MNEVTTVVPLTTTKLHDRLAVKSCHVCFFVFLQRSFFIRLTRDNKSEKFFKVFHERMKLAQQEIKATVTVNTSDIGSKRKDEDATDKEAPGKKRGAES